MKMPDDRFAAAWEAFREADAAIQAPPHLEAAVFASLDASARPRARLLTRLYLPMAAAAAIAMAWAWFGARSHPAPAPLEARALPPAPLPSALVPDRVTVTAARRRSVPTVVDPRAEDPPVVLMMFEPMPGPPTEPLQLVRLRVPGEALLALGVTLFEPDAAGMVDIDLLVGEDGLPKDMRKVRVQQEEQ